ncbi:uncharacterized protein LOC134945180 [Pseudophryne corroboree]|uniref:uncharacterized protein LOC134945180 n=1 Tax=Pseudophryne corroboree TaxID=495146 RepID=UPI003081FD72
MYEFLQGRMREIGLKFFKCVQKLENEKYQSDRPEQEHLTQLEKWQRRIKIGKSKQAKYYQPPTPKSTKQVSHANCPAWSGKGKLGKKTIILRNTCSVDNLLFITHMAIRKYDWILNELDGLKTQDSSINTLLKVYQHFQRKDWIKGKIEWLKQLNRFRGQTVWDAYGSEEDFVVCRLNYLLTTTVESICSGPFCPEPVTNRSTNLLEICCDDLGNIQTVLNTWTDGYISSCKRKRGTSSCDGIRTFSKREFKHGLPCILFVTIVKKTSGDPLTCPSRHTALPSIVTVSGRRYKPVAVTYNVGEHFICFFRLTDDDSWHCYDGIKEFKDPGKGIEVATTELIEEVLVPGVTVGHVIMVRLNESSLNIVQEPAILKDMIAAQKWVEDHKHTFSGQVFIPSLLSMTKNEAEDCIKKYHNDLNLDSDMDDCREHFIFAFTDKDDMEKFLTETRDKQTLLVHTKLSG